MNAYAIASVIFCLSVAACGGDAFQTASPSEDAGGDGALVPTGDVAGESSAEDGGRLPGNDAARADSPTDAAADRLEVHEGGGALDARGDELALEAGLVDVAAPVDVVVHAPDAAPDAPSVPCGPSSCAGCCDPAGRCQPGTAATACGSAGLACMDCLPAYTKCVSGGLCAY